MGFHPRIDAAFNWLVDGALDARTPMAVIERIGSDAVAAGVPLDRVSAFVRTLHPNIMGRRFDWAPGEAVRVTEATWAMLRSPVFLGSPIQWVFDRSEELRLTPAAATARFPQLADMVAAGFTDYLALPLAFHGGSVHAIVYATKAPGGFAEDHVTALRHLTRPLGRVAEILALTRTAANLISAYVGRDAGERVLEGRVQRGEVELIRCVIWFSDLRGFTTMSGGLQPNQIIGVLNEFFDCQVPALERHGGEVLKFIGDGLLAIVPIAGPRTVAEAGKIALSAAREAFTSLRALNEVRARRGDGSLAFGVGLHVGEVAYGNIGGASRLDFTAIGPSVNVASRIEGLTGKLGKAVLISGALAAHFEPGDLRPLGAHELKGVAEKIEVFEPMLPV